MKIVNARDDFFKVTPLQLSPGPFQSNYYIRSRIKKEVSTRAMQMCGSLGEEFLTAKENGSIKYRIRRISKVRARPPNLKTEKPGRAESTGKAEEQSQGNFKYRDCLFLFFPGKDFLCGRIFYGIF
jgi:hypothetical protein